MIVSVRKAMSQDAVELAQMRWDASIEDAVPLDQPYTDFAAEFVDFLRAAVESDQWVIWIAECEGRVVAHMHVYIVGMVPRPGRLVRSWGYAAAVYCVPKSRNMGIGSQLLGTVIDWAKAEGLEFLLLSPSDRSIPFYERAGFVRSPDAFELGFQP